MRVHKDLFHLNLGIVRDIVPLGIYRYIPKCSFIFFFLTDLPYEMLYILSLALPLGMVFLGEMALWTFSSLRQDRRYVTQKKEYNSVVTTQA